MLREEGEEIVSPPVLSCQTPPRNWYSDDKHNTTCLPRFVRLSVRPPPVRPSPCMYLRLSVCLSVFLYVRLSFLPVRLCVFIFVLSVCLSLSLCIPVRLAFVLSACLSIPLYACPSVCMFVHPSVCLPVMSVCPPPYPTLRDARGEEDVVVIDLLSLKDGLRLPQVLNEALAGPFASPSVLKLGAPPFPSARVCPTLRYLRYGSI